MRYTRILQHLHVFTRINSRGLRDVPLSLALFLILTSDTHDSITTRIQRSAIADLPVSDASFNPDL